MSRETKVGLVVAVSFVCLVGVVVASRMRRHSDSLHAEVTPHPENIPAKQEQPPQPHNNVPAPPPFAQAKSPSVASPPPSLPKGTDGWTPAPLFADWTHPAGANLPVPAPLPLIARQSGMDAEKDQRDKLALLQKNVFGSSTSIPGKPEEPAALPSFPAPPPVPAPEKDFPQIPPPQPPAFATDNAPKNIPSQKAPPMEPLPSASGPFANLANPPMGPTPPVPPPSEPQPKQPQPFPPVSGLPTNPNLQPMGAEAKIQSTPVALAPVNPKAGAPKFTSFDVTSYVCTPQDTSFEDVSNRMLGSPKYAKALLTWNREESPYVTDSLRQDNPRLQPGQKLIVPPKNMLELKYASLIDNRPAPSGVMPAFSIGAPASAVQPVAPPAPISIGQTPQPVIQTSDVTRPYRVPAQGQMLIEIAQQTLGDRGRWSEIYRLNPSLRPEYPVPGGSEIRLPANARVPN